MGPLLDTSFAVIGCSTAWLRCWPKVANELTGGEEEES